MNTGSKIVIAGASLWLLMKLTSKKAIEQTRTAVASAPVVQHTVVTAPVIPHPSASTPIVTTPIVNNSGTINPVVTNTVVTVPIVNNPAPTTVVTESNYFLELKKGDSGQEVKELQTKLGVTPSGTFDQNTENALYNKTLKTAMSNFLYDQNKDAKLIVNLGQTLILTDNVTGNLVEKDLFLVALNKYKLKFDGFYSTKTFTVGTSYANEGEFQNDYFVVSQTASTNLTISYLTSLNNSVKRYYAIPKNKVKFR